MCVYNVIYSKYIVEQKSTYLWSLPAYIGNNKWSRDHKYDHDYNSQYNKISENSLVAFLRPVILINLKSVYIYE